MRLHAIFYAYPFTANNIRIFWRYSKEVSFLVYRDIDQEIADVALKYFLKHATLLAKPKKCWLLSVYGETPPYSVEAVKVCMLFDTVDIKSHLMDRNYSTKTFLHYPK